MFIFNISHRPLGCLVWLGRLQVFSLLRNTSCTLNGTGHYWLLLKIIVSITPYLVTSNNIVRNGSLRSIVVFRERSKFSRVWFWGLRIRFLRSRSQTCESTQLRVTRVFFSLIIISQLQTFTGLLFYALCWEDWSLTITTSVQCLCRHWTLLVSTQIIVSIQIFLVSSYVFFEKEVVFHSNINILQARSL